jgi:hypothetical protein
MEIELLCFDGCPSHDAFRGYEQALRDHVFPALGGVKLAELHRNQVQDFIERLAASGAEPTSLRNAIMP